MKTMIQWNEGIDNIIFPCVFFLKAETTIETDNKIRFMRLSSDMFPFASHEKVGYGKLIICKDYLIMT